MARVHPGPSLLPHQRHDVGAPGLKRGALLGGEIVHLVDADNAGTAAGSVP